MHGIALPYHGALVRGGLHGADMRAEVGGDVVVAVAGDECDFADFVARVKGVEEGDEVGGGERGGEFDADGVGDAAEVFDVGAGELAGAIADPEEVGGGVVVLFFWFWRGWGVHGDGAVGYGDG